jgi:2-iminoacetate synthase
MIYQNIAVSIDEEEIGDTLTTCVDHDAVRVREILAKAMELKGLDSEDVAVLMGVCDPELLEEIFLTARRAKETIYGRRLVLFAPLYVSNLCSNECLYCAFRASNKEVKRRSLTQEEIAQEVRILIDQGHKRTLLVSGETYPKKGISYILDAIETIYATKSGNGEIRRINVNISPLNTEEFRELKAAKIGTYQLFQETYHRETYEKVHVRGEKRDFDWRISAMDRAMEAAFMTGASRLWD